MATVTIRGPYASPGCPSCPIQRQKLAVSERERERLTSQLSAERNLHKSGRKFDALFGLALGSLLTLTTLAMLGAIK